MELLAANDQENAVHRIQAAQQVKQAGAVKGARNAPKTPFKLPLNDENTVIKGGKTLLQTAQKEQNAFVTPAGPRNRAPLGMKTTNAKARAFQTPAPPSGSAKTLKVSPRLRRPKIKVLEQPVVQQEAEQDVPDVEYMPPKEIPLPDLDDNDMPPINWDFPQFKGAAMTRGFCSVYLNPLEDDGRTRGERELEESLKEGQKKAFAAFDKQMEEMLAKEEAEAKVYLGIEESPIKAAPEAELPKKKTLPAVSTLSARSAAAALSATAPRPRYAAPTVAAKSRVPGALVASKKAVAKPAIAPSTTRNAAGIAASKSTIGYAQGRAASAGTTRPTSPRKPLSNVSRPPPTSTFSSFRSTAAGRPTTASSLTRPTTASSLRSRPASAASTRSTTRSTTTIRPTTTRPRIPFPHSGSPTTATTLLGPERETLRTAEDIEREDMLRCLYDLAGDDDDDDENADAWMRSFEEQLGLDESDPVDDLIHDFQFKLPEDI